ncbi:MAG: VOC family protein [Bacillus sp. (in: Bacteria)]|nr:VOC family protein [Bacillus sp. (in: firmicutes)]
MQTQYLFNRVGCHYISTTNIDESIEWYTKKLGLKFINQFQDRGSFMAVLHYPHKNAIATVLIETKDQQPLEIIRNGILFPIASLACENIEYTHRQLIENEVAVQELITLGNGEAKYFYFRDNMNNLLEASWSIWDQVDEFTPGG